MSCIGRNRKLIYNTFCNLNQRRILITYDIAKKVIKETINNADVLMQEKNWPILLKFAEKKDGLIDYKLLVDVYRDRALKLASPPI